MKTLTSIIVAAALIAPAAASAGHRINTPGTESRHEANLSETKAEAAPRYEAQGRPSASEQSAEEPTTKRRPRAALAGKVNVAARSRTQ